MAPKIENQSDGTLVKKISLRYPAMLGDTLDVLILEFKSDVYALDYFMNSGEFQGSVPTLKGEFIEQSIRADHRIFVFRHDSFRSYERGDLEKYVRQFPGYRGGFPQEFLSMPFEHREVGTTSIQTKYFLGEETVFPVLVQSYRENGLRWNVARSWELVSEEDYKRWSGKLHKVVPRDIPPSSEEIYFTVDAVFPMQSVSRGMAKQLPGGRVVVVWGYLAWFDLERKFIVAANRIYEARY